MVLSARGKKRAVIPTIRPSAHKRLGCTSPLNKARVSVVTGVSGATQLSLCTISGNEVRGKKTPLKKNIGVINRV